MDYKEAIYHFRKFAIRHGFIEEYKKLCNWGLFGKRGVKDIPHNLKTMEPVKYIQNAEFFCCWPSHSEANWYEKSKEWAKYCLENGIYYNLYEAKLYVHKHIYRLEEYYQFSFKA